MRLFIGFLSLSLMLFFDLNAVFVPQKTTTRVLYQNRFYDQYYLHNRFYYSQYPYEFDTLRNGPYDYYYTDPRAFYKDNGGIYYRR